METILVVEDDYNVRQNIIELLICEGYNCLEAEDGLAGAEIIKNELPDLILCDLMMPRIDGFEFYQIVKSLYPEKFLPIIFLTARSDEDIHQYAMAMGADDFLVKPFKMDALLERIKIRLFKKRAIEQKFDRLKMNISLYVPHELKTPLISILGYAELMLSDFDNFSDDEKKDMLNSIYHSGLRTQSRIEKFINYSELKLNASENRELKTEEYVNPSRMNSRDGLNSCFECNRRIADISFNFADVDLLFAKKDFETMMMELIENACKFSTIGSQIEINGVVINDKYEITIKNEGTEIDVSTFESFSRKDENYNQRKGNGIGLSIVKMILKKYNAQIRISAEDAIYVKVNVPIITETTDFEKSAESNTVNSL